jgi:prolyl 4-hydroxylase
MTKSDPGSDLFEQARAALFGSPERPSDRAKAAGLFLEATRAGHGEAALRSAVFAAEGYGRPQNWNEALALLIRAAELGERSARKQLDVLAGEDRPSDWRKAAKELNLQALLTPPPTVRLTEQAFIIAAPGFAPPGFSAWLIKVASEHLQPSLVSDHERGGGKASEARTAWSAAFGAMRRDFICAVMAGRAARLCGRPILDHEAPNVISYEPGQEYAAHYDFIRPAIIQSSPVKKAEGQRLYTFVTYLNEDFEGGATSFLDLGLTYKGKTGDALIWANVLPNGEPDAGTLHAGLPPTAGRKWILSQWIRDRPNPFR